MILICGAVWGQNTNKIGSTGNVGIGTTTPQKVLHVKSTSVDENSVERYDANLLIEGTHNARDTNEGASIGFVVPANTDGSNPWQQGRILVTPGSTNNYNADGRMLLQTRYLNSSSWDWRNNLVLLSNGNVGIGTKTPSTLLTLDSNINESAIKSIQTFKSNGIPYLKLGLFGNNTNYRLNNSATIWTNNRHLGFWAGNNGYDILFATGASVTEQMRISHNGKVGIGTNSPDGKLHVKGGIAIQNPTLSYDTNGNAGERAGIIFGTNHPTNNSMFWISPDATQGNRLNIGVGYGYNDNGAKLTIENNGEVGIGTTSPSAKLDVAGNIKAHEIEVTLATMQDLQLNGTLAANNITYTANGNTADFVFEDNYQLKDLSEVEAFIKSNKHLPEIPSAAEMEEVGVNLAEMNKLLLMKVEELTLYSIEQEKKIEKLTENNKRIEKIECELTDIKALLKSIINNKTK